MILIIMIKSGSEPKIHQHFLVDLPSLDLLALEMIKLFKMEAKPT